MFENYRKSLIQYCERSELHLHYIYRLKMPKNGQFWRVFENSNATFWVIFTHCGYIRKILPRSVKPWGVLIISFFLLPTLWNFFHFFFKFPRVKGTNKCVLGSLCCQDFFFQVAKGHFYNMLKTNLDNDCTSSSFVFWLFFARVKTLSNSESWRFSLGTNILFENYSKCRIFSILAFFTNFCPI